MTEAESSARATKPRDEPRSGEPAPNARDEADSRDEADARDSRDPTDPRELRPISDPSERSVTLDSRTTDPDEAPASSVRPSAPTLQGSDPAGRPIVVRTPVPPTPRFDAAVGPLSTVTTTPTGRDPHAPPRSDGPRGLIGATLGRYEILEELGHGGMATVYRAHDPRLDRDVALKVIHHHLRDNPEIAQRFRHEARAVAKLKHRSIVEIYDVPDSESGERFLVAEYVDGPSLRKYLQNIAAERAGNAEGGPRSHAADVTPVMPAEIAAALVLQIVEALSRAHQEGIIHRDVKPENILIAGLGAPTSQRPSDPNRSIPLAKLTDFGIAKILDAASMTSTGQILGSPAHMSPEQIEGGEVTVRVDVFATGVLFYELLTGNLPFDGKNPAQVIRRVLDGQFTAADRVVPTVGGRWASIVASLLARDPEKRPASIDEVRTMMRAELSALGVDDPDAELVEFLRSPITVERGWGARVKPRLLARAAKAREDGDVIGAANDLNRALAYDPGDPKLVRAVTSLRARERRNRKLKQTLSFVLASGAIAGGTFYAVRWARRVDPMDATTLTSTASAAGPDGGPSVPIATSTSRTTAPATSLPIDASVAGDAGVVVAVADASATASTTSGTGATTAIAAAKTRVVHFTMYPPGTFSVDGAGKYDPGDVELAIGDHTIVATGQNQCCALFKRSVKVEAGDGPMPVHMELTFNPAPIFVTPPADGVAVTVTVSSGGAVVASATVTSDTTPINVPMKDTSLPVTITMVASGYPTKVIDDTLRPGDASYKSMK